MNIKLPKKNLIFYTAYIFYYISIFATYTSFAKAGTIKTLFAAIALMLLLFNFIISKLVVKKTKEFVIKLVVIAVVTMVSVYLKDYFFLVMIMFAMNMMNNPNRVQKIFKISFYLLLILTVLVLLLCLCGVLQNKQTSRFIGSDDYRYSLGFYHSNVLPNIILYLTVYYYIYKKKVTMKSVLIFEFVGLIVFLICDSKNAFLSMQLFLVSVIIYSRCKSKNFLKGLKFENKCYKIACISYPAFCILSILLLFLYQSGNPFALMLDDLLNSRLYMIDLYLHYQELRFVNFFTADYFRLISLTLDNGYYYSIARYGIIYLLFISYVMICGVKKVRNDYNNYLMIAFIVLSLTNFIDNGFFSYSFYPFLLYSLSAVVNGKKSSTSNMSLLYELR